MKKIFTKLLVISFLFISFISTSQGTLGVIEVQLSGCDGLVDGDYGHVTIGDDGQSIVLNDNVILQSYIVDGAITPNKLASTGSTAGTYTNPTITINSKGQILSASNGTGGGGLSATKVAKSLSADIIWTNGTSGKQEITDLSNVSVVAGKIYKLTFYGVVKNNATQNQGFIAEWILSNGAAGEFAGIAFGQHNPTGLLGEMWTVNNDALYRRIETDKTIDIASKHSLKIEAAFTCTASGELDLYFGGLNGFAATLFSGSAIFVEEF